MVTAVTAFISLVLMISGLVLRNILLLIAASISWIIFAFLMFEYTFTNTAINTGLLLFGGAMAIISVVSVLGIVMSKRPRKMTADDEQRAHAKQVLDITKGPKGKDGIRRKAR